MPEIVIVQCMHGVRMQTLCVACATYFRHVDSDVTTLPRLVAIEYRAAKVGLEDAAKARKVAIVAASEALRAAERAHDAASIVAEAADRADEILFAKMLERDGARKTADAWIARTAPLMRGTAADVRREALAHLDEVRATWRAVMDDQTQRKKVR